MYQTIGARFNDEMGFVPRVGVDNAEVYLGTHFRPKRFRELDARNLPALPDRELHQAQRRRARVALHGLALAGHAPEQHVHRGRRQPERRGDRRARSRSTAAAASSSTPGRYEFNEYFVLANTNAAAPFSLNLRYGNRRVLRRLPPQLHRSAARSG